MEIKSNLITSGSLEYVHKLNKLENLAKDRGLATSNKTVAQIKYEIAYAEGYMIGKAEKANKEFISANKKTEYIIGNYCDWKVVTLTEDQVRLLDWLNQNDYFNDDVEIGKITSIATEI